MACSIRSTISISPRKWLIKPSLDAHVLVIEEQLQPGATIDLNAYADAVRQGVQGTTTGYELKEERSIRVGGLPGRWLHIVATSEGLEIEYYFACLVRYELAYQVIGFARTENFPAAAPELTRIINSFQLRGI